VTVSAEKLTGVDWLDCLTLAVGLLSDAKVAFYLTRPICQPLDMPLQVKAYPKLG
jgi:hypothetical protein